MKNNNKDIIIERPVLVHYAPNEVIPIIKKSGLFNEEKLCQEDPSKKEGLRDRYLSIIKDKYGIPEEKIKAENILHFLKMWNPLHTKSVFAFFGRIPESIPQYKQYLKTHTPIRILLKKLNGADEDFKFFGVNFPGMKNWVELQPKHIHNLCDKKKDWFEYFMASDKNGFFNQVPHCAIHAPNGVVPAFSLKVLDDKFIR